ncbi:hypothetical protein [Paraburkholderia bannensis]|uniref:hypothetical protein n=1 Tax=Paraburkholderia bannensis TaxID=765414 RepID=UPI002AB68F6B|nr:hypothetical protein [Paraburkholderia bannensis]
MSDSNSSRRTPADMTVRELASLRLLNDRLAKTERWILERALSHLMHYRRRRTQSVVHTRLQDIATNEDIEVQAQVLCIATCQEETQEQVIALLDGRVLLDRRPEHHQDTERHKSPVPHPLADLHPCRLFDELRLKHLADDWSQMLAIDAIRVEFSVVQRRAERWTA